MFFKTLRDLARPQVVALFDVLKRSDGLAVGDLAEALKMSYMGVKQYCVELEKRGYLDTWRRAKETGRPELTYRLTPKAQLLFPQLSNELSMEILEAVRQLHGATAAEKILYQYFLKKTEAYSKKIKGKSLVERATSLARLRENEGYCAQVDYDARHGLRLTEFHSPLADLIKAYPSVARMEEAMLSRLLQAPVHRDLSTVSGLMRITFLVAGASLPPPPPATTSVRSHGPAKRPAKESAEPAPSTPAEPTWGELVPHAGAADEPQSAATESSDTTLLLSTDPAAIATPETADPTDFTPPEAVDAAIPVIDPLTPPAASHESLPTITAPEPVELLAIAPPAEEPLLFAPPTSPLPRPLARAVAPPRPAAKAPEPEAEELFLSL
jgi:predicted ArsR family transcriptional regulator